MKEGKIRKFAYKKRTDKQTDRQTVQRLRPLYPLWILEGAGQLEKEWVRKLEKEEERVRKTEEERENERREERGGEEEEENEETKVQPTEVKETLCPDCGHCINVCEYHRLIPVQYLADWGCNIREERCQECDWLIDYELIELWKNMYG